jgi:hyperosmotically inducible protein
MRNLMVLVSILMLSGCTAMMVGGNTGGYQQGKDERSMAVTTSDSTITTKIKSKYAADSTVSVFNIGIRTWKGTVTLSGTVGSYVARDQAEALAKETSGVQAVNNHIVIEDRSAK